MDEQMVRGWLKEQQDRAETLAQQQAAAFQLQVDTLRAELQATRGLLIGKPPGGGGGGGGGGDQGLLPRSMRLDVPKFTGADPDAWLFAIQEYFTLLNAPADQRLRIVGFNLEGAAAEWFRWMSRNGLITDWERFVENVRDRFGPSKFEDPQGALSKLLQLGTVEDYQRDFEKLMNRVTDIPESLLISFYISGLKLHLQRELLVAKPTTLGDAFALARVTEARLDDQASAMSGTATKAGTSSGGSRFSNARSVGVATAVNANKPPLLPTPTQPGAATSKPLAIKWISPVERQERLTKGLCFNCDNKWARGHKCPAKFLLLMTEDEADGEADTDPTTDAVESGDISILNSLIGQGSPRSLQWSIGSGNVHVLIDNGSTHNFVRPDIVEKMQLPVQTTKAFKVYIGSGETLLCEKLCTQVKLGMQGLAIEVDLYALPMQGLDVVLGIQWLQKLGKVPTSLSPHRVIDHRIHLLPNTKPVNVETRIDNRTNQKGKWKCWVKGDYGSYCFCMDYRALNEVTVKDKFPIPNADEMFDELGGAVIFTKLDLRAGYHQIRVHDRDVYKTAFRTHDGHYEFLVMPFGLTNVPSTFQATMNRLFSPYLRKFVIAHQFYVKRSKCAFGASTLEYLGHIISGVGVEVDPKKIAAGYAAMAAPLTDLLRKDGFRWGEAEAAAFESLKLQLTMTTVLSLPNFDQTFIVETDVADAGIGAVLLQNDRPICYFSHRLGPRMQVAATYQKELFAIVEAVFKWREYLLGRRFIIRTDHRSIKELLQQDSESLTASFMHLSQPLTAFLSDLKAENSTLADLVMIHRQLDTGTAAGMRKAVEAWNYSCLGYFYVLRAMVTDHPTHWVRFLPWAEYCYNTTYHSSIKMTPYQALYGKVPMDVVPYPPGTSKVAVVDDALCERDALLRQLRDNLLAAKNRMEVKANRKRRELEFSIGDKVLVKLQPYRQLTLAKRVSNHFAKRYYGPFEVVERVGKVAYRLALPVDSKMHPVFHVSLLKLFSGSDTFKVTPIPEGSTKGHLVEEPVAICGTRAVLRGGRMEQQVLVQWAGRSPEEATWEWLSEFQNAYPAYDLEDKVIFKGTGNDTPAVREPRRTSRASVASVWHKNFVKHWDIYFHVILFRIIVIESL
ncbi:ty3-gypsy retrotransposon protein [Tanacetum coccineum]